MTTGQIVCCAVFLALAAAAFVISCLQFMEKGYLFNNAYFWISREERKRMDESKERKKPHYRQSGFAFLFTGFLFLIEAVHIATGWIWLFAAFILAVIIAIVWAIVSSVLMERHQ